MNRSIFAESRLSVIKSNVLRAGVILAASGFIAACNGGGGHDHHDDPIIVVDGPGNTGYVRYLDTFAGDTRREVFYQEVAGKYEPETVTVWVFPSEASLLVLEHQLDGNTGEIAIYARVAVFDEYATASEMMSWLDNDLAGYSYPVQPQSVTWIDNAVHVTDLFYHDSYQYGDAFVDEYEVQYFVDGVSVPGEFVLYEYSDFEYVIEQFDL